MADPLMRLLAELPSAAPETLRSEQVRVRCQARLARSARRSSTRREPGGAGRATPSWQPLVAGLGFVYLAIVIVEAVRTYGN